MAICPKKISRFRALAVIHGTIAIVPYDFRVITDANLSKRLHPDQELSHSLFSVLFLTNRESNVNLLLINIIMLNNNSDV